MLVEELEGNNTQNSKEINSNSELYFSHKEIFRNLELSQAWTPLLYIIFSEIVRSITHGFIGSHG